MAKVNHYTKSKYHTHTHLMTWRLFFRFSVVSCVLSFARVIFRCTKRAKTCLKHLQNGLKCTRARVFSVNFLFHVSSRKFWWNRAHCDSNNQQFYVIYWIRVWLLDILFENSTRNVVDFFLVFFVHENICWLRKIHFMYKCTYIILLNTSNGAAFLGKHISWMCARV